jgi:predicted RNA-binding protein with PUA-like domain
VSLSDIKADRALAEIALIKQSRLSVMPLTAKEYDRILLLAGAR